MSNEENAVLTTLLELKLTGTLRRPSFHTGLLEEIGLIKREMDWSGGLWVFKMTDKGEKYLEQQTEKKN